MIRIAALAAAAFQLIGVCQAQGNEEGVDYQCPCPIGEDPSEACKQCRLIRCEIGGSALSKWVETKPWAKEAGKLWTKTCQGLSSANLHSSTQVVCQTTAISCVEPCEGQDIGCAHDCNENQHHARHACTSFPWPVPFKKVGLAETDLPAVFT
eukprot:gb/GFBE01073426.1/.p1 GENE.gb/GFBE01073426.1/~~gb/GFBE01073426.1/.p1  ORF type:complete len:153 (+),score=18.97 gb/GFBE01073426.1/:1-459(+)